MVNDVALPGTQEFEAKIRYFEGNQMRRFETPLWAHSFVSASINAEKILLSAHPSAAIMAMELIHKERQKHSVPRLVIDNPKPRPPSSPPPKSIA